LLFTLERLVFGLPADGASEVVPKERFGRYAGRPQRPVDLTLDLCGPLNASLTTTSTPTWTLTFDGSFGEHAALGALLGDHSPAIEIIDVKSGDLVASARAGSAADFSLLAFYEDILVRASALVVAAIEDRAPRPALERSGEFREGCAAVARFSLRTLARLVRRRLYLLTHYAPHWRVGWRFVDGPDVIDLQGHPESGWKTLADDGFHSMLTLFRRQGRAHLSFCRRL